MQEIFTAPPRYNEEGEIDVWQALGRVTWSLAPAPTTLRASLDAAKHNMKVPLWKKPVNIYMSSPERGPIPGT